MFDDYSLIKPGNSLIKLGNRLAVEGEELVAHRFHGGAIGMVSRADFERWQCSVTCTVASGASPAGAPKAFQQPIQRLWQRIKRLCADFLIYYGFIDSGEPSSEDEPGPIVGIPSEALVRVLGISSAWQEQYQLGSCEDALFIELSPLSDPPRHALCFGNGAMIPLDLVREGQKVKVLRRSWSESLAPNPGLAQLNS